MKAIKNNSPVREKNKIKIRLILFLCCFFIFLTSLIISLKSKKLFLEKSPEIHNFILLSIDDLRADRLGCYGNKRNVSPCIDSLAHQGIRFLYAFSPWPFTPPAHSSLLTSLYPSIFDLPLDPKIKTLASILHENGYKTAAFTSSGWMSKGYGILNGFKEIDDRIIGLPNLEKKIVRWLNSNRDKKFFLFLHTYYVHVPFVAPEKYFLEFADHTYSGPIENTAESTNKFLEEANEGRISVKPEDRQRLLDIYDGQIKAVDGFVCSLFAHLTRLQIEDKTMFIITSDHGEQFYEHKYFGHSSPEHPFADISTRVPLIIYCPALSTKEKVIDRLVELIDLPPTILEAAKIKIPETFQGKSFFPLLRKKYNLLLKKKKQVFFQTNRFAGFRTRKLKLVLDFHSGEKKLYDLVNDPAETKDISQIISGKKLKSLIDKLRVFQEKNDILREKLGLTEVVLEEGLPSSSLPFDGNSIFLAPLDDNSFIYKTENYIKKENFDEKQLNFVEGKFGKGLLLIPKAEFRIPFKTALSSNSGAIEFWLKLNKEASLTQKIFNLDFMEKDSSLSIQGTIYWLWTTKDNKRGVIEIIKKPYQKETQKFSTLFSWKEWHHILISWENEEIFLLIDGNLSSRQNFFTRDFFEDKLINYIKIDGENCVIDDLRVSNKSRLSIIRKKKLKLDNEVIERLKALGYIDSKN